MEKNKTTLTPSIQRLILERDEFTCTECRRQVPKVLLFIDRILSPESEEALGDVPEEDKYTCLCEECYKQAHSHLQIKAATRTAERRRQLEMLVEWRRENKGLESDTTSYLIDYINGKIEPYSLSKQGTQNVRKAIRKSNFTTALDAIDETFLHYVTFDNGEDINQASVNTFINKIGGYLYINSLPPVEQEMYHVLNCCKVRFNYWDQKKAKGFLQDYVNALREQGWDEERILEDLKTELRRVSNDSKNWSEWKEIVLKWTSDIRGWSKEKPLVQDESGKHSIPDEHMNRNEDISITFASDRFVTFKYLYETSGFCNPHRWRNVLNYLDDELYRFLINQRNEFTSKKGIPLAKPIEDVMVDYVVGDHLLSLMLEDDEDLGAGNENMPTGVKSYFFEDLFVTILRDMFSYFYLPSTNYDFRSSIKAIDYFIRNYKEVFRNE
jgi:hypothetical protein